MPRRFGPGQYCRLRAGDWEIENGRRTMKPNLTNPGKVVITIATTGGLHGK